MAFPAILALGLISGALQGVGNVISNAQARSQDREQAVLLRDQIESLQDQVDTGEVDRDSAIARINDMFDTASSSVKTSMETQANLAVDEITSQFNRSLDDLQSQVDGYRGQLSEEGEIRRKLVSDQLSAYRENMDDSRKLLRSSMAQARLGRSGAMVAALRKSEEQEAERTKAVLDEQGFIEKQISDRLAQAEEEFSRQRGNLTEESIRRVQSTRLQSGSQIANQLAGLDLQRGGAIEGEHDKFQQRRDEITSAQTQLGATAGALEVRGGTADTTGQRVGQGFLDFFSGFTPDAASGAASSITNLLGGA